MSFILDIGTEDVPEITSVPQGEYELKILSAETKDSKKGDPMIALYMEVLGEATADNLNHYIMLPTDGDDEKTRVRKLNRLKEFKSCFHLPSSGPIASEDMVGATGWAILGEEESQEFGKQNRVKRFIVGSN
jgi:hypothetical protein